MTERDPRSSDGASDRPTGGSSGVRTTPDNGLLTGLVSRARWIVFWERRWPPLAAIATVAGLFLVLSWIGLWLWLPPYGRIIGIIIFAALFGWAAWPLVSLRFPTPDDGLRRLDHASGIAHRPATAIADHIATSKEDPWSLALWRAHVERALLTARCLTAGSPAPRLALRDPMAIRALVLILGTATFVAAGNDRLRRIELAFDWQGASIPANFRLDAWVSPPTYTGKPPLILPGIRPGEQMQAMTAPVSVPAGSVLVVRSSGKASFDVVTTGGLEAAKAPDAPQAAAQTDERRFTITERGTATVHGVGHDIVWSFTAVPDRAPTIELTKDPEPQARGAVQFTYKIEDDYGVVDAQAVFTLKPAGTKSADAPRPLYAAPDVQLVLPQPRTRNGIAQTMKDLSEHPWSGADVVVTLVARDEAGNEGRSTGTEFRLPQRVFTKSLAKALIEQRRTLALDADARDRVVIALDALAIAPDKFAIEPPVYLGLRAIYWNLVQAKTDDDLRDVVHRLWSMATQLEDGNVSDAEARLRQAQDALRQALERGASDEEIKKLTEELRAAMDKFLQALAEEMRRNPQQNARRMDPNSRMLRQQDLKSMLDRLEQLSRSGAKDAARQLLDQLQQMLENLQMARPGGDMDDGDDDMMSALDELGDMIRKQQQLRDRTFRQGQEQRRGQRGQRGQQGQQGQDGQDGQGDQFGELRQDQQGLRDQLKKLLEDLKKRGLGQQPGGQGGKELDELGRAGDAMGDAEGALGDSNADGAVDGQGRALDALRQGAQNLAQAMQQQLGMGPGGPGQPGRNGQARANPETDPLGRPMRGPQYGDDVTVKVPGEIDVQRARRILEELRRRLGEANRPKIELDYIERLLKDF
ncbi:MAG: TIGR02302 family protein [Xanthobacteraceae bacterium]